MSPDRIHLAARLRALRMELAGDARSHDVTAPPPPPPTPAQQVEEPTQHAARPSMWWQEAD